MAPVLALLLLLGTPGEAPHSCPPEEFSCGGGSCIPRAWVCDGEGDCPEGGDERGCPPPPPCPPHAFRCNDSACVPRLWRCDGDRDCPDGSDEWGEGCGPPSTHCPPLQIPCASGGGCVPRQWRCDGGRDCGDGSDEEGCAPPPCPPGLWRCGDGRCLPPGRRCDRERDCGDGSDEMGCGNATACDAPQWFRCRSGECIPRARVCDGRGDCRDRSDEPIKECGLSGCLSGGGSGGCSHLCQDLPLGYRCLCPGGFTLGPDGHSCQDLDECQDPLICPQLCLNFPGSFECRCGGGYRRDPQSGDCIAPGPPPTLLWGTQHELWVLPLGGGSPRRVLGPRKRLGGLDGDLAGGGIYWGDPGEGRIYRSPLSGRGGPGVGGVPVVSVGPGSPAGVALDWVHQNLYWTP